MCLYSDESRGSDLSPGGPTGFLSGISERKGQRELSLSNTSQNSEWNSERVIQCPKWHRTQVLPGRVSISSSCGELPAEATVPVRPDGHQSTPISFHHFPLFAVRLCLL